LAVECFSTIQVRQEERDREKMAKKDRNKERKKDGRLINM
jgi:hypothetical protein